MTFALLLALDAFSVEVLREAAPVHAEGGVDGLRILRDGRPHLDFWFRRAAALQPGALVGVLRVHDRRRDLPPGVYTLRHAVRPGAREFLVPTPAADNADVDLTALLQRAGAFPIVPASADAALPRIVHDEGTARWRLETTGISIVVAEGAPSFEGVRWADGAPDLAGKVAIVRWWTSG